MFRAGQIQICKVAKLKEQKCKVAYCGDCFRTNVIDKDTGRSGRDRRALSVAPSVHVCTHDKAGGYEQASVYDVCADTVHHSRVTNEHGYLPTCCLGCGGEFVSKKSS